MKHHVTFPPSRKSCCDIFCRVIDNYGDAAICWRLAKELSTTYNWNVRLIIDNSNTLARLLGHKIRKYSHEKLKKFKEQDHLVDIIHWNKKQTIHFEGASLIIETFGCKLDDYYLNEIIHFKKTQHIVWINLEYLSAEQWINSYHLKTCPHPNLPISKTFFFPGFTNQSGGLLRDKATSIRKNITKAERINWWESHYLKVNRRAIFVSVFCYNTAPVKQLIQSCRLQKKYQFILLLTQTLSNNELIKKISKKAKNVLLGIKLRNEDQLKIEAIYELSENCSCVVLPFYNQENYDKLLCHCDFNFIRGEDSFIRAQWAGHPFCWHIYPQEEKIHKQKLDAFLNLITQDCTSSLALSIKSFWHIWNFSPNINTKEFLNSWMNLMDQWQEFENHTQIWKTHLLKQGDLTSRLLTFYEETKAAL